MLCRMPAVHLPGDLSEQLNNSVSGAINDTEGPGVAVYWASDGLTRADIYLGLQLDGFTIDSVDRSDYGRRQRRDTQDSDVKIEFYMQPEVDCKHEDGIEFNPQNDKLIPIKVTRYFYIYVV